MSSTRKYCISNTPNLTQKISTTVVELVVVERELKLVDPKLPARLFSLSLATKLIAVFLSLAALYKIHDYVQKEARRREYVFLHSTATCHAATAITAELCYRSRQSGGKQTTRGDSQMDKSTMTLT